MTPSIASTLPRLLGPAAVAAALLAAAPAAHAEADGSPHAWLTSGTPLTKTTTVWVRQEGSEDAAPVTVTTTIKVGAKTFTLAAVTSPAIGIFQSVPVTITVPADVRGAAKKEAANAGVTDAQVTFKSSVLYPGSDRESHGSDTATMPLVPGIPVGQERISGVSFTTGAWPRVAHSKWGVSKFAPIAAGNGCSMVVSSRVGTVGRTADPVQAMRGRLGNAKIVKRGSTPLPYLIGTLEGGVPRLVNGVADNAPPIVRAEAAVRTGRTTKILDLEARPDAGCKASKASTNAAIGALQRVLITAHPAS